MRRTTKKEINLNLLKMNFKYDNIINSILIISIIAYLISNSLYGKLIFQNFSSKIAYFLSLFLLFSPMAVQADDIELAAPVDSPELSIEQLEASDDVAIIEAPPKPMTQEEIDELLGEDPYLGQTSWLGAKVEPEKKK